MSKKWIKDTLNNLLVRVGKGRQSHHLNLGCPSLETHILNTVRGDHIDSWFLNKNFNVKK